LPKNWANFLSLPDNKADLANFLSEELLLHAPEDKVLVVAGGFTDELEVRSSKATTDLQELSASHEEADTRLVLYTVLSTQSLYQGDTYQYISCTRIYRENQ